MISWRNFNLCNIIIHFNDFIYMFWHCCNHVVSHITSFGPGVYRRRPWFPLLPKPSKTKYSRSVALSEYIPPAKIHRACFLNLAQWSVYLEWKCSERRSHGAQHGWLKGKVMTLSACVFGSCETTAGSSPWLLNCNSMLLLTSERYWYWLLAGCVPSILCWTYISSPRTGSLLML